MSDEMSDPDNVLPHGDDLDAEFVRGLLEHERARGPESDSLRERVYRRVVNGAIASGNGEGNGSPPATDDKKRRLPLRASAAIGAVLGAVVIFSWPTSESAPRPRAISVVEDRAPVAAVAAPNVSDEEPSNAIPTIGVDALPSALAKPAPSAAACTLCEEQRLLVDARTALGRRAFDEALASLGEHQRRFPHGQLTQEREALRVRALAGAGRREEARSALVAFESAFPSNPFLPSLRGVVEP